MTTFETYSSQRSPSQGNRIVALIAAACAGTMIRVRVWKNRREVARLLRWDAHMLRDIGLTAGDVTSALATRADEDASVQLSMLSLERRFAHKAQTRERLAHAAEMRVSAPRYRRKA